jgi:hypothetical protein
MTITQLFVYSLKSPKKIAAFRLIPIGKVMTFVFIFIFILTILSFINFTTGFNNEQSVNQGLFEYVNDMKWILLPFAFIIQFIMSTLLIFIRISLMAFIGMVVLKSLKRRGDYRHVWRTTAFAYTVPTILSILLMFLPISDIIITVSTSLICFVYLFLALRYYPQK